MVTFQAGIVALIALLGALCACSREQQDWRSAESADTSEGWARFIEQHPDSELAARPRERSRSSPNSATGTTPRAWRDGRRLPQLSRPTSARQAGRGGAHPHRGVLRSAPRRALEPQSPGEALASRAHGRARHCSWPAAPHRSPPPSAALLPRRARRAPPWRSRCGLRARPRRPSRPAAVAAAHPPLRLRQLLRPRGVRRAARRLRQRGERRPRMAAPAGTLRRAARRAVAADRPGQYQLPGRSTGCRLPPAARPRRAPSAIRSRSRHRPASRSCRAEAEARPTLLAFAPK